MNKTLLVSLVMIYFIVPYIQAQVTIGSSTAPACGSILELKDRDPVSPSSVTGIDNVTSVTGGLGLPRVQLVDLTTLEPFIPNDADWTKNTGKIKEKYVGLTVYNIKISHPSETDADRIFQAGIYIWNGSRWRKESDNNQDKYFIRLQPFNLPLNTGQPSLTYDLYEEYKRQYSKSSANPAFISNNPLLQQILSGENKRLYTSDELDFAITFYDDEIITVNSINVNGVMTYAAKQTQTGSNPKVLMNVVLVIK